MGITIGRLDFDDIIAHFKDRNIKRPATEVVDGDGLIRLLVKTVGQRGGSRFVDNAFDVQASDAPASLVAWRWLSLK